MWMSDAFAEMMLGHLVCLVQGNAFILVEWAYPVSYTHLTLPTNSLV